MLAAHPDWTRFLPIPGALKEGKERAFEADGRWARSTPLVDADDRRASGTSVENAVRFYSLADDFTRREQHIHDARAKKAQHITTIA